MLDIIPFFGAENIRLFIKIPFLVLIILYTIFAFILYTKIKSLSRIVFIESVNASNVLNTVALVYFLAALMLFLLAIVIL